MRLMTHVDVEERNGRERDDRIDSRAGGRHEQFILSDVDSNAFTADGIAEHVQKPDRRLGQPDFHRHGYESHECFRGRKDEGEVEERKPKALDRKSTRMNSSQ